MSRDCCVALPHGAMGLSAVCDCGISRSHSLFFSLTKLKHKTPCKQIYKPSHLGKEGSKGHNIFFSESGNVAYQIKLSQHSSKLIDLTHTLISLVGLKCQKLKLNIYVYCSKKFSTDK